MAATTIEIIATQTAAAAEWKSLRITEQIGQPDTMSVDEVGFTSDPIFTQPVRDLFAVPSNYYYTVVRRDGDVLFSGLIRGPIAISKAARGALRYGLQATGWEFLLPLRLVGAPSGAFWEIIEDGDAERLPTPVAIDPSAHAAPTPAGVRALFAAYWPYPPIDTDTYVTAILPAGATEEELTWSGSDLGGAIGDLAAAGSASALSWFANDSPDAGDPLVAPNLALHFGIVILPDEGDEGDDLGAGLPSADLPDYIAPYAISDTPDGITSVFGDCTWAVDHSQRRDGIYVRGATGFTQDVVAAPPGWPVPYQIGETHVGGSGWVGAPGVWGEEYVDAPAAISESQRDAFGNAFLASRQIPAWTGTIRVVGYHGWHKGQIVSVTDADFGFAGRWFLIRAVTMVQHDPFSEANEYTLTVGDTLIPSLGYALRQQRHEEQRKAVEPATKFVPYVGDLQLDPGGTAPVTMQLATASGKAMAVPGVGARWHLMVNGEDQADPQDTAALFYLSDVVEVTDTIGQVTATLHASADATAADAANPWCEITTAPAAGGGS